jgi:hypothetical protein
MGCVPDDAGTPDTGTGRPTLPLSPCQGPYICNNFGGVLITTLSASGSSCIWTWTGSAPEEFTFDSFGNVSTTSNCELVEVGTWSGTAATFTVTAPVFAITPGESDTITCYQEAADQ